MPHSSIKRRARCTLPQLARMRRNLFLALYTHHSPNHYLIRKGMGMPKVGLVTRAKSYQGWGLLPWGRKFVFNEAYFTLRLSNIAWNQSAGSNLTKPEDTLPTVNVVLLDAEQKQAKYNELKVWLESCRISSVMLMSDDVLDEFQTICSEQASAALLAVDNRILTFPILESFAAPPPPPGFSPPPKWQLSKTPRVITSFGETYTFDRMLKTPSPCTEAASECHASGKASSACVPIQTASIISPFTLSKVKLYAVIVRNKTLRKLW
ncbi:Rx, N-terminal [Dillenia turbinata]|uniref:Rx, N-terminal n=1 Tax=Dillenia turbinata TaxID=194707 RepID=A0AAN8WCD8_9MAGN